MKAFIRVLAVLTVCGVTLAQQSYVKTQDSPGSNPYWSALASSAAAVWTNNSGSIQALAYGTNLMFNPSATGSDPIAQITTNLTLDSTGLWIASPGGHVSVSTRDYNQTLFVEHLATDNGVAAAFTVGQTAADKVTQAMFASAWSSANMTNEALVGVASYLYGFAPATSMKDMANFYAFAPVTDVGLTITSTFAYWADDLGGMSATHPYYEWSDSRGVRRVKEDNTFNSVGQAIETLYNPQFTKYTPGAVNHERVVLGQWNGNVAEIGTEKGGTGTLRPLRLLGAGIHVSTNLNVDSLRTTNGVTFGDGTVQTTAFTTSSSLWNTNGAGRYSPSDTFAQSLQFGSNTVASGIYSVALGVANTVSVGYGTIAGGQSHLVRLDGIHGTIGGGQANDVRTLGSFIGGGLNNVTDSGDYQVTAGGNANVVRGDYSFLGGGDNNLMGSAADGSDGVASVIGGGRRNIIGLAAGAGSSYSAILGGRSNIVAAASDYSTISGGSSNRIGDGNAVSGNFIGGGFNSTIGGSVDFSVIGGGVKNVAASDWTAILGGVSNNVTATYAMAIGNWLTNSTTKSVEIGADNLGKVRFTTRNIGSQISLGDTNGLGGRINLYASTNSGAATLYVEGSPVSQTMMSSPLTTNLSIVGVATLFITNGLIYAIAGP